MLDPNPSGGGAPAPAPSPTPAPAPAPVESGVRTTPQLNDAFSKLDELWAEKNPSPEQKAPEEQPPKPEEKKLEEQPPQPKPEEKSPKPEKAATLRENYERLKNELKERDARLAKYQEMEKSGKFGEEEKKTYEEKVAAAEKRRQELEEKMQFIDYKESQHYKDNFEKPFVTAYSDGRATASQFKINDPITGESRQATAEDFDSIMQIADPDAAASKIEELFGTGVKAAAIADARKRVLEAHRAKQNAIDEFSKKGSELRKQNLEQQQKFFQEISKTWKSSVDEGMSRLPQLFKPVEGDTKGNEILDAGYRIADLAFDALDQSGMDKLPDWVKSKMVDGKLPAVEKAKLHAAIRNKAGAFDRVAVQLKQEKAKVAELMKKLEGFEKSKPDDGELGRIPAAGGNLLNSVDAAIEKMAGRR